MERESSPPQLFMRRPHLEDIPPMPIVGDGYGVRTYAEGDEKDLARVLSDSFLDRTWTVEKVYSGLIIPKDVEEIYVATFNDIAVATASARFLPGMYPGSGYLHWVGVHPDHRGKGLGRMVTLAVMHHFKSANCRDSVLETDDFRIPAIKLYLSLGYQPEYHHLSHQQRWENIIASFSK